MYHGTVMVATLRTTIQKDLLMDLYAQLHYFLNFSQRLSCLPLLDKLINPGVPDQ